MKHGIWWWLFDDMRIGSTSLIWILVLRNEPAWYPVACGVVLTVYIWLWLRSASSEPKRKQQRPAQAPPVLDWAEGDKPVADYLDDMRDWEKEGEK